MTTKKHSLGLFHATQGMKTTKQSNTLAMYRLDVYLKSTIYGIHVSTCITGAT